MTFNQSNQWRYPEPNSGGLAPEPTLPIAVQPSSESNKDDLQALDECMWDKWYKQISEQANKWIFNQHKEAKGEFRMEPILETIFKDWIKTI